MTDEQIDRMVIRVHVEDVAQLIMDRSDAVKALRTGEQAWHIGDTRWREECARVTAKHEALRKAMIATLGALADSTDAELIELLAAALDVPGKPENATPGVTMGPAWADDPSAWRVGDTVAHDTGNQVFHAHLDRAVQHPLWGDAFDATVTTIITPRTDGGIGVGAGQVLLLQDRGRGEIVNRPRIPDETTFPARQATSDETVSPEPGDSQPLIFTAPDGTTYSFGRMALTEGSAPAWEDNSGPPAPDEVIDQAMANGWLTPDAGERLKATPDSATGLLQQHLNNLAWYESVKDQDTPPAEDHQQDGPATETMQPVEQPSVAEQALTDDETAHEQINREELIWHYGPTQAQPDPSRMWHTECGGEVLFLGDGYICSRCEQQEDAPVAEEADRG